MRQRLAMRRQQLGMLQWLGFATLHMRQMIIVKILHTLKSPSCAQAPVALLLFGDVPLAMLGWQASKMLRAKAFNASSATWLSDESAKGAIPGKDTIGRT